MGDTITEELEGLDGRVEEVGKGIGMVFEVVKKSCNEVTELISATWEPLMKIPIDVPVKLENMCLACRGVRGEVRMVFVVGVWHRVGRSRAVYVGDLVWLV
jgi:hypothetical protein